MRVYEFAKQHNLSAKEVLELLRREGHDINNHMAVLGKDAIDYLEKTIKKSATSEKKQPEPVETTLSKEGKQPVQESQQRPIERPVKTDQPVADLRKTSKEPGIVVQPTMLSDIALAVAKPVHELIVTLLKMGLVYNKNQIVPEEVVAKLARQLNIPILEAPKKVEKDSVVKKHLVSGDQFAERLPVVVVVGHVDHGKTTLLDFIRKTRVAAREKGGITQHLGAYEATTAQGNIVFLDTPGHEAFSKIRVRGVKVADIAILVVAADDGVMPQTVEAIKHIKNMGVPVIVAINKVDKVDSSRLDVIKRQLAQHDLLPEDWGGDVICVPLSAKTGLGVDQLLEMILLQAQIMELKADVSGFAHGYVLEAKIEKGLGIVATVICQKGTLHIGDYFKAGAVVGKVTSLVNSQGARLQEVGPSVPVLVAGFDILPEAGDIFEAIDKTEVKKTKIELEMHHIAAQRGSSGNKGQSIIIKTDTNSSKEALIGAIEKLSKKLEKGYNVIAAGIGNVTDSDIELAANTNALILILHTKIETSAAQLASRLNVHVKKYDIIYRLLEDLEVINEQAKEKKLVKVKVGEATVLKVFDIKNLGVIAGSVIKEGRFNKDGNVIIYRGNKKIGEGPIKSLQRDRKAVKEVHTGFECAFLVGGFTEWRPDDRVECYLELPEGSK